MTSTASNSGDDSLRDNPDAPLEIGTLSSLLSLAAPLILVSGGHQLMNFVDGLLLSRYSEAAIAAQGPSSMLAWTLCSLFLGAAGYCGTFVAQYEGAQRHERVAAIVWQGLWFSIGSGIAIALLSWPLSFVFAALGHEVSLAADEAAFFRISCLAAPVIIANGALAGFYAGRGDTKTLMWLQIAAQVVNIAAAAVLIYGLGPFPRLGLAGGAWAAVIGQTSLAVLLGRGFLVRRHRRHYGTWRQRGLDWPLLGRLLRFGLPNGLRMTIEMVGWTWFLLVVGRLGSTELVATNVVWRINTLPLFPLFGIAQAVTTQVGQAQGRRRPDLATRSTWCGLIISEIGMLLCAALFLLWPEPLLISFLPRWETDASEAQALAMGVILLRYVAAYCLTDGINLILIGVLNGAGDTRATLLLNLVLFGAFSIAVLVLNAIGAGIYALWVAVTVQVTALAICLFVRFMQGRWRHMQVIEVSVVEESSGALSAVPA